MRRVLSWTAILALVLAVTGCQALFSTSLGSGLARTSYDVAADISNADAAAYINDPNTPPAMLSALLDVLNDQAAAGDVGAAGLAAGAAIGASDASASIMEVLLPAMETMAMPAVADLEALLASLQDAGTAAVLTGLEGLSDPDVLAAADLAPTDLVIAAILLAASAFPPGADPTTYNTALFAGQALADYNTAQALVAAAQADITASGGDPALADLIGQFLQM